MTVGVHSDDPFVVFMPRLGRFMLVELWSVLLGICIIGILLSAVRALDWTWDLTFVAAAFIGVVLRGALTRGTRRIVIGDEWVAGPMDVDPSDRTTIQFGTVDRVDSHFQGRRLRIVSISGRGIEAKTAWYAPADVEEIRRLLRDRCEAAATSESGS